MRQFITILILLASINLIGAGFNIDTITINSTILSESRTILLLTPCGLKNTDTVSVIYMLDGEFSKYRFEQIVKGDNNKIIGIGIINTDKRRDLLPVYQADKFNNFIENELFSKVETRYAIKERILYGHSFGGAYTIYSMINKPSQFDKYIASSPTPIMNLIDTDLYQQLDSKLHTDIKFYLSYGSKDMRQVKKWASRLIDNLLGLKTDKFHWTSEVYDGENHHTSDKVSIIKGLEY